MRNCIVLARLTVEKIYVWVLDSWWNFCEIVVIWNVARRAVHYVTVQETQLCSFIHLDIVAIVLWHRCAAIRTCTTIKMNKSTHFTLVVFDYELHHYNRIGVQL